MSIFLTSEWHKLIMAQYVLKPMLLTPYLPNGLELDLFQGSCYLSLVGFLFDRVRLKGVSIPFHTRFEEINLRFYVRRTEPDGTQKRGVVFIREFVPRTAIARLANALYEEPYATLPTHSSIDSTARALNVQYSWRHSNRWHSLAVEASPTPRPIAVRTEEEFLTEHYWGYTKRRNGSTSEYEVKHPRWQTYPVRQATVDADFTELYGPGFSSLNAQQPASVLLAEGSAVSVHSGSRLSA